MSPTRLILALAAGLLLLTAGAAAAEQSSASYAYTFQGRTIALNPSTGLVASREVALTAPAAAAGLGLTRMDTARSATRTDTGYALYALPAPTKGRTASALSADRALAASTLAAAGAEVQPVFEQGWALVIPCDRVVVGFDQAATADEALNAIWTVKDSLGILDLAPLRPNTFVATISDPADGRAFAVARALSELDGVRFAEPDLMLVWQRDLAQRQPQSPAKPLSRAVTTPETVSAALTAAEPAYRTADRGASPGWLTLTAADAESATLPSGWFAAAVEGLTDAYWGRTNRRAHSGSWSYYCARNGSQGLESPGPAPTDMLAYLTFVADFSGYEEAYVEFWFYAKNEVEPLGYPFDYGYLAIWDPTDPDADETVYLLNNGPEGDMTIDPTTDNGWRRCLVRVPPALRTSGVVLEFDWVSDNTGRTEGLYIDDIRVFGTYDVDTEPLGADTYAGRQYELRNVGQVAGLGSQGNDLHMTEAWSLVPTSAVTVAVIDDGVDLAHPDLNLVQGYDWTGLPGGEHKTDQDGHGTACAGNIGAVANTFGVRGTAPGVPIMPVEVLSSYLTDADLATAIDVAVAHGAKVLSNSWGWVDVPVQVIVDAIHDALDAGRSLVFSAGNGPDRSPWTYEVAFPGNQTGTLDIITAGATSPTDEHKAAASSDGQFWWGSSYVGPGPDVMAPAAWSYTTDRLGALGYNDGSLLANPDYNPDFGGTSSAAPKIAGICTLLYQANAELYPRAVKDILMQTADTTVNHDPDKSGAGRVNASAAVRAAQLWHAPAWWWDKTRPGTGLAIELQDEKIYLAWYVYDAAGRPVWYASLASRTADQTFAGTVFAASGSPLGIAWDGPPVITTVGACNLTFQSANLAVFNYSIIGQAAGGMVLTRLLDNMDGLPGHAYDPRNISGWWWDPAQEGMGVFLEARGATLYLAWYHYRADRSPRWWSLGGGDAIGEFPAGTTAFSATLRQWQDGQTVGGPYAAPTYTDLSGASLTVNADGTLTLTSSAGTYTLQRFQFSQF